MNKAASRTGLFLMELIIGILFFSLAGALCIQMFVKSHLISESSTALNHGVLWSQNVAETFQGCGGNTAEMASLLEGCIYNPEDKSCEVLYLLFDDSFEPVIPSSRSLSALKDTDYAYILSAFITREADLVICSVTVGDFYLTADQLEEGMKPVYQLEVSLFPGKEVHHES